MQYEFNGVISAIDPQGFEIIARKACSFTSAYYRGTATLNLSVLAEGYRRWVRATAKLPLNIYKPEKRNILSVAILIESMSACSFAAYSAIGPNNNEIVVQYTTEITALVMGIILYDIALRTASGSRTVIHYIDIEKINAGELHVAISALRERRSYKYKFRKLLEILGKFSEPATFH